VNYQVWVFFSEWKQNDIFVKVLYDKNISFFNMLYILSDKFYPYWYSRNVLLSNSFFQAMCKTISKFHQSCFLIYTSGLQGSEIVPLWAILCVKAAIL